MNKKDLIIFLVLAYLMYKVHCLTKEQFSYQEPTQAIKNLHVDNIKKYKSALIYIDSDIQTSGSISSGKMMYNQGACVPRIGHYYTLSKGVLTGDENNC